MGEILKMFEFTKAQDQKTETREVLQNWGEKQGFKKGKERRWTDERGELLPN